MGLPRSAVIVRLYPPIRNALAGISSKVFPPSVLNSKTPPSKPRFGSTAEASRLKLCRNDIWTQQRSKNEKAGESSRLSLNSPGSSMNAAFGGVSVGGAGRPLFEVTHNGGGPNAFVASHPAGNAGGVTRSKFSLDVARLEHGAHRSGLRISAAVA